MTPISLVLVGLMGSGKSTIATALSKQLALPHLDLDEMIEQDCGLSIAEIFAAESEPGFRVREHYALQRALANPPAVIATGGGVVVNQANRRLLRKASLLVVWLDASLDVLAARLGDASGRPLLLDGKVTSVLGAHSTARRHAYQEVAHMRIDNSELSIGEVVACVSQAYSQKITGDSGVQALQVEHQCS